jgi:hypothetical protein
MRTRRTLAHVPLFLVLHHHGDQHARYAVHTASSADAVARLRAAHPEHRGRFRVELSTDGDVLALPDRGRPRISRDQQHVAVDHAYLGNISGWSDIT